MDSPIYAQNPIKQSKRQKCNLELNISSSYKDLHIDHKGNKFSFSQPLHSLIDSIFFNNKASIAFDETCIDKSNVIITGNGENCSIEELKDKIQPFIKKETGLDPKNSYIAIDTIIRWKLKIIDSLKFYSCGIYFNSDQYNKLGILTLDNRGSLKRYDNTNEFIYFEFDYNEKMLQILNRINFRGHSRLVYSGDTLDFGINCYIPPQFVLNNYSLRKLLLNDTGIEIEMAKEIYPTRYLFKRMSLSKRRKFFIQNSYEIYNKVEYFPYNNLRINK